MKNYVIIGNGTAAAGCIEGIRSADGESKITVISAENRPVYCRPLISYYLEGKTTIEKMNYRPEDFYEKNGCEVVYGQEATSIDPAKKTVSLSGGAEIPYDKLCIATGSSPFVPPVEGLESVKNKFSFMTIDDALSLEHALTPQSRVLIVGAGLIGLKCAEGICARAGSITVCDLADRVLSSILDTDGAAMVQKKLEEHGIRFLLNDTAKSFEDGCALMASGERVYFDVLVMAVGVRANIGIAKDAGCECSRGITVNDRLMTTVSDIYAAGDCTQAYDITSGAVKVMAIMPNAYMQGRCAGENMAGGDSSFSNAMPMNSIGFFGLHVMTAGCFTGDMYEERTAGTLKRLFTKDNKLIGFELIGCTDRAGIYTNMIRNQIPLDTVEFDALKKMPNLYLFGKDYCKQKLGGVV